MKSFIDKIKHKLGIGRKLWFTSDLHFNHTNVISYCNRPFANREEMNEHIIKIWNSTVKPQDTVFILGDFSLNPKIATQMALRLNGTKCLVSGNHDACFIGHKKSAKMVQKYQDNGFDVVFDHMTTMKLKDGTHVRLSHLPYIHNEYDDRYRDFKPHDNGEILLHGHLHGRYIKNGRQIDVSWDANNGKILSEDDVIAIIKDPKEFIPSHITEFYKNRGDEKYKAKDSM
jgi:calcineurin-like phosphoesterase family protein